MGRSSREGRFDIPHDFLSGWKEIAGYLKRGIRTVQRYERDFGLPVRRPAGNLKGVFSSRAEIDAWVKKDPIHLEIPVTGPATRLVGQVSIKGQIKVMRELLQMAEERKIELWAALAQLNTTICGIQSQRDRDGKASPSRLAEQDGKADPSTLR